MFCYKKSHPWGDGRTGGVSQRAAFNDDAKVCIFIEIYKSLSRRRRGLSSIKKLQNFLKSANGVPVMAASIFAAQANKFAPLPHYPHKNRQNSRLCKYANCAASVPLRCVWCCIRVLPVRRLFNTMLHRGVKCRLSGELSISLYPHPPIKGGGWVDKCKTCGFGAA